MVKSKNFVKKICFIGLGVMGAPIVRNMLKTELNLTVYDIDPHKREKFRQESFKCPESLEIAAKDANVVFTILPTSEAVKNALFDRQENSKSVVNSVAKNCIFIDMTTGSISELLKLNNKLSVLGHRLIDAPVGRSPREAKVGKSLIMAGGHKKDIEVVKPIFESFADTIIHVGEAGDGLRLKLVNNYMAMVNHVLTGEVLSFANHVGLDRDLTVSVLSSTAAGKGQLLTNFPQKVLAGDISPDFSIKMGIKDLNMALELALNSNFNARFGQLSHSIFSDADASGLGEQDCTAVLNYFNSSATINRQT